MARSATTRPAKQRAGAWALGALLLVVAALVGLTLHGLRDPRGATRTLATGSAARSPHPGSGAPVHDSEIAPWHATPENASAALPGTVPAWRVNPPRPDPSIRMPLPPDEPPNPAQHRPPLHNPGGVNGDRPERGLD